VGAEQWLLLLLLLGAGMYAAGVTMLVA